MHTKRCGMKPRFCPKKEIVHVTPYSEIYSFHPHRKVATKDGWKSLSNDVDFFTGKSTIVMRNRREKLKLHFCSTRIAAHWRETLSKVNATDDLSFACSYRSASPALPNNARKFCDPLSGVLEVQVHRSIGRHLKELRLQAMSIGDRQA